MIFTIRVPQGYKTPNSLEEAARVMGGQLTDLKLIHTVTPPGRYTWEATIVLPKKVVVQADPENGDWVPGWQRLEEEERQHDG